MGVTFAIDGTLITGRILFLRTPTMGHPRLLFPFLPPLRPSPCSSRRKVHFLATAAVEQRRTVNSPLPPSLSPSLVGSPCFPPSAPPSFHASMPPSLPCNAWAHLAFLLSSSSVSSLLLPPSYPDGGAPPHPPFPAPPQIEKVVLFFLQQQGQLAAALQELRQVREAANLEWKVPGRVIQEVPRIQLVTVAERPVADSIWSGGEGAK